jgi:hypothetical protein
MWVAPQYETVKNYFCVIYQIVRKLEVANSVKFIRLKRIKMLYLFVKARENSAKKKKNLLSSNGVLFSLVDNCIERGTNE